jgi:hypothetical protein
MNGINKIFDFNNDGCDDVWDEFTSTILYGGIDITKLQKYNVEFPDVGPNRELLDFYQTPEGEYRFLFRYKWKGFFDGYELYKATWDTGGTKMSLLKLDSLKTTLSWNQEYLNWYEQIYQFKQDNKCYLMSIDVIDGNIYTNNFTVYDLTNDKFVQLNKLRYDGARPLMLEHSLDGDEYPEWCMRFGDQLYIYSGKSLPEITPIFKASPYYAISAITTVEDISSDGINDLVLGVWHMQYKDIGEYVFLKGKDLTTSIKNENTQQNFSLKTFKTTPSHFTISFTLLKESHATFSLFDIEGKLIKVLKEGMFEVGAQSFTWDSGDMPQGAYLLQLSDGGKTETEKIIIVR